MAYNLYPEVAANIKFGDTPGHADKILVAPIEQFTAIQTNATGGSTEGDTMVISTAHTFATDDGFLELSGYRDGAEAEGESKGEPGFQGQEHKVKLFVVGDHKQIKEKVKHLMNRGLIVMYNDPDCAVTRYQQLGCKCSPAVLEGFKKMSGNKNTGGKKGFELTFSATCMPADYTSTITLATVAQ